MAMPKFSDPGGFKSLPLLPPFYFEDMTTRVFPLRSSLTSLQNLVDRYVNIIPPEVGRFRVVVPFTMLMMVNYGKLAVQAANMGWLAQREVLFAIPVAWYRVVGGRWELLRWAYLTPFIFVDSDIALTLGRQVYGWPKLLGRVVHSPPAWMEDPRAPVTAAALSTPVFGQVYTGSEQLPEIFLDVRHERSVSPLEFPPDLDSPFAPWSALANAAAAMAGLRDDSLRVIGGLGLLPGHPASDFGNLLRMAATMTGSADPRQKNLYFDTLNLKQFRDSARPENYCYQALTCARMAIESFKRGGLLGDASMLSGDTSGGYSIRFSEWPSLPIATTLGLDVANRWRGDGVEMVEVKPLLPFWYQVDMSYQRGHNVAERSFDRVWRDPDGRAFKRPTGLGGVDREAEEREDALYNSTLGASSQTVAGPFDLPKSTRRVLPLLADATKLRRFLDEYLNQPLASMKGPEQRFELWCGPEPDAHAYVYLMATHAGDISSGTDNIGNWASEYIGFWVPVKWYEGKELRSLGMVPVFTISGDTTSVISNTEVLGWPTGKGIFTNPPNVWMTDPGPEAHVSLLSVSAEVIPALAQGQQAQRRPILEIHAGEMTIDRNTQRLAEQWATAAREEVDRKAKRRAHNDEELDNALALALEVLANRVAYNLFTLKQFRDVGDPDRACYQSVVRVPHTIEEVFDIREIEEPLHVRIQQYPSHPMVELLGLEATLADDQDGGQVYLLRPVRPFWMRTAWREGLGQPMWYRSGSEEWTEYPQSWSPYFRDDRTLPVSGALVGFVDDHAPVHLPSLVREWRGQTEAAMSLAEAREAVDAIEPQMIIERILSREWENRDGDTRWRLKRKALDRRRRTRIEGKSGPDRWHEEIAFFQEEIRKTGERLRRQRRPRLKERLEYESQVLADLAAERAGTKATHLQKVLSDLSNLEDLERLSSSKFVQRMMQVERFQRISNDLEKEKDPSARKELARKLYKRQRESLLDRLSKAGQAPAFFAPRAVAGEDRDRLFPKKQSMKGWYVGPPADEG